MAGFRVLRRRHAHQLDVRDAELAKLAAAALVAADERVGVAAEELGFAEAELGSDATTQASETLAEVRSDLHDAFRLHRRNHEVLPGAADDMRARNLRIVQLCERAVEVLDAQASALTERVARSRRAPEAYVTVRADIERLRARIPHARETLERLAARYPPEALVRVEGNPADAAQLLGFAEHSLRVAEQRREAGQREQAGVALEASAASVHRAAVLLDAVDAVEIEALGAEFVLAALADQSRRDLAGALAEPRSRAVANRVAELPAALAVLPSAGVDTDPFEHLSRLREAHASVKAALILARERETNTIPPARHVHRAIEQADRQLEVARDACTGHPGWVGGDALARLAEAERARADLGHCIGGFSAADTVIDQDDRAQVIAMADRVAQLAAVAVELARRNIAAYRSQGGEHRGAPAGPGAIRGGADVMAETLGR